MLSHRSGCRVNCHQILLHPPPTTFILPLDHLTLPSHQCRHHVPSQPLLDDAISRATKGRSQTSKPRLHSMSWRFMPDSPSHRPPLAHPSDGPTHRSSSTMQAHPTAPNAAPTSGPPMSCPAATAQSRQSQKQLPSCQPGAPAHLEDATATLSQSHGTQHQHRPVNLRPAGQE